tara:strand:- start:17790 stop:20264 length:2475 start_codon:yes stop_codon:yes gene_type:complete
MTKIFLNSAYQNDNSLEFWYINKHLDKNNLKSIICWLVSQYGGQRAGAVLENLKRLGFEQAIQAGVSIGAGDITPPPIRDIFVPTTGQHVLGTSRHYHLGQLTGEEKAQQAIDGWFSATELLSSAIVSHFNNFDKISPIHIMAFSGARGNITQVRQLIGIRGLMLDPIGKIITSPIRASFREGLTVTEYLISAYGARKGLVDTALRTANAGYLTRRLIDVLQDVVILQIDCGPLGTEGCFITDFKDENGNILVSLQKRLLGRVTAEPLKIGKTTIIRNTEINQTLAKIIAKLYPNGVYVRSPITCGISLGQLSRNGVCQLCYGWDLSLGDLVELGEAVGIIAAQSIGEPGTQLTMRTFHTGGVVSGQAMDRLRASGAGRAIFPQSIPGRLVRANGGIIGFILYEKCPLIISCPNGTRTSYEFPRGVILLIRHGQWIHPMQELAQTIDEVQLNRIGWQKRPYRISSQFSGLLYSRNKNNTTRNLWILSYSRFNQKTYKTTFGLNYQGDWIGNKSKTGLSLEFQQKNFGLISGLDTFQINQKHIKLQLEPGKIIENSIRSGKYIKKRFNNDGRIRSWSRQKITIQKIGSLLTPQSNKVSTYYGIRIEPGFYLGELTFYTPVAGDIVQALPKIEAFFEARSYQSFHRGLTQGFYTLIKLGFSQYFSAISALRSTQQYIRNAVQLLYLEQGIYINDRHIELVVSQIGLIMLTDEGKKLSELDYNQPLTLITVCEALFISSIIKTNPIYEPVIIGITKAALIKNGFLGPASFQETVKVLTKAAIEGQEDRITGLKESIILGQPVSIGTMWCNESNYLTLSKLNLILFFI